MRQDGKRVLDVKKFSSRQEKAAIWLYTPSGTDSQKASHFCHLLQFCVPTKVRCTWPPLHQPRNRSTNLTMSLMHYKSNRSMTKKCSGAGTVKDDWKASSADLRLMQSLFTVNVSGCARRTLQLLSKKPSAPPPCSCVTQALPLGQNYVGSESGFTLSFFHQSTIMFSSIIRRLSNNHSHVQSRE